MIAEQLYYKDVVSLMTSHLPCIVKLWVESKYDVMKLPHQHMGFVEKRDLFK